MPRVRPLPAGLHELAFAQDRVLHRKQLLALGMSAGQVRHKLDTGRWVQPLAGVIKLEPGTPTYRQRLAIAYLWTDGRAVLAGLTAAALAGVRGLNESKVHLLFPRSSCSRAPADWIVVHRTRTWDDKQFYAHVFPPRQQPAPALVLAAGLMPRPQEAVALLASGVQQRRVDVSQLRPLVLAQPELTHRGPILAALTDIEGGAHSLPEVEFAQLCRRLGLPTPTRQAVRHFRGRRRYLDVTWDEYAITVEIDGQAHTEIARWMDDLIRGNSIATSGQILLRFSAQHVRLEPEVVAESLLDAFRARGWRR